MSLAIRGASYASLRGVEIFSHGKIGERGRSARDICSLVHIYTGLESLKRLKENLPNEKTVKTILNSAAQIMCRPSGEKNAWSTPTKPASIVHSHFGFVKSNT